VKNINFPMLLLATFVIMMFAASAIAIASYHLWTMVLFLLLGTGSMGYGISLKKRSDSA